MEKLDTSGNSIIKIPDTICNLKNLKYVNFSDNNIEHVDEGIFRINALKFLDLSNNEIKLIQVDFNEIQSQVII